MQKTFEKMNESNVMEILNDQNLIVEILLGTPIQKFNVHLRTDAYSTYLLGPQVKSSCPTFDIKSSSYRKIEEVDFIFSEDFKKADLSQENFLFGDSKIDNVSFSLVTEISALKINKTSGVIGLKFDSKTSQQLSNTSWINKLHSDKKISRNAFYFHFDERDTLNKDLKDNKNEFIFGAYPHQFNNEYSENCTIEADERKLKFKAIFISKEEEEEEENEEDKKIEEELDKLGLENSDDFEDTIEKKDSVIQVKLLQSMNGGHLVKFSKSWKILYI